jgi:RES domain-containing protein
VFVYRIEKEKYQHTFPPRGSLFAEGRWSRKGMWVVYTSETVSLAKLEALANSGSKLPANRYLTTIEIKDSAPIIQISQQDLPADWNQVPFRRNLSQFIQPVIESRAYVAIMVPSIHSPNEHNFLLLPDHPQFGGYITLVSSERMGFDNRLKPA